MSNTQNFAAVTIKEGASHRETLHGIVDVSSLRQGAALTNVRNLNVIAVLGTPVGPPLSA